MFSDHFTAKTIGSLFLNPTKLTCCFLSFMTVCITTGSVSPAQVSRFLPLCCSFSVDLNMVQRDNLLNLQNQDKTSFHKWKAHRLFFCLKLALCYVSLILFFSNSCFQHRCNWRNKVNKSLPVTDSLALRLPFQHLLYKHAWWLHLGF